MLSGRLQEIFRYIEPRPSHDKVYSHELRMIFMLACMEVESACKAVLLANGVKPLKGQFNIFDYPRLARPMRLNEWTVQLTTNPTYGPITPFVEWIPSAAPTQTLSWYSKHNKVKHDREKHLSQATLGNTIQAVAAVYVMRLAQFGKIHVHNAASPGPFARDEFEVLSEPSWEDHERYVAPETVGPNGKPLAPRWKRHQHSSL